MPVVLIVGLATPPPGTATMADLSAAIAMIGPSDPSPTLTNPPQSSPIPLRAPELFLQLVRAAREGTGFPMLMYFYITQTTNICRNLFCDDQFGPWSISFSLFFFCLPDQSISTRETAQKKK